MAGQNRFRRLGWLFILLLSSIAVIAVVGQLFIQASVRDLRKEKEQLSLAHRQQMLGQRLAMQVLQMERDPQLLPTRVAELEQTLELFTSAHSALQSYDHAAIHPLFEQIQLHYNAIAGHAEAILRSGGAALHTNTEDILTHERAFYEGMEQVVAQYEQHTAATLRKLRTKELSVAGLLVLAIFLEWLFVFRPVAADVRKTTATLVESERQSVRMAEEMSRLYEELVKSYQELEAVNMKPEMPVLYATVDQQGSFIFFSTHFQRLMELEQKDIPHNLKELLLDNGYNEEFVSGLIRMIDEGNTWSGELKLVNGSGDFCWLDVHIIPVYWQGRHEYKLIAKNITEIKEARIRSREINREKVEARVREQQYRSVLILEGQEEERQRLGREIHDGLGQMLTALKLSLEAITPSSSKHTVKRLEDTRGLMKSILKEVRRISFNLTPSSLSDFGVVPAVKKFCQEVNRLSAPEVTFENKTRFVNRLEQHVENNLYRIIQEGVNNAIKYAQGRHIAVTFEHDPRELTVTIDDDGRGFDYEKLVSSGHFERSGHGIFNMKERAAFINAKFELFSEPGSGTRITIKLPLDG